MKRAKAATRRKPLKKRLPKPKETLAKARDIECRKRARRTRAELFLLASIVLLIIILFAFSKYMVRTRLDVSITNQSSVCFSGQDTGSSAAWSGGSILVETSFETVDPCYQITSINAEQQGDGIRVDIETKEGGICIQCFGYRRVEYELASPRMENDIGIEVYVDGLKEHTLRLFLAA